MFATLNSVLQEWFDPTTALGIFLITLAAGFVLLLIQQWMSGGFA
jgi:hypothetical protein